MSGDTRIDAPRSFGWARTAWMVGAGLLHAPLPVYLGNSDVLVRSGRQALIALAVVVVVTGCVLVLARQARARSTAVYTTMLVLVAIGHGGQLVRSFGEVPAFALVGGAAALCAFLIWRLYAVDALHVLMFGIAAYLTLSPFTVFQFPSDLGVQPFQQEFEVEPGSYRPDIFVIIPDSYPGLPVLQTMETWEDDAVRALAMEGFEVEPAWASYPSTFISIPSLLGMGYLIDPSEEPVQIARDDLRHIAGGEGAFYQFAESAGYHLTFVETPWFGSKCADRIDTCVRSPLLDEAGFRVVQDSMFGGLLLRSRGSVWAHGGLISLDWLRDHHEELTSNEVPDLVVLHVLLPHWPFVLDQNCGTRFPSESTDASFVDQVGCVDSYLTSFARNVSSDAVVVIASDHGVGDAADRPPSQWTEEDIFRRTSSFYAMRAPDECRPIRPVVVPNILRGLVRCIANSDFPQLEPRLFLVGKHNRSSVEWFVQEVDHDRFRALASAAYGETRS